MTVPSRPTLPKLAEAVQTCTACQLYRDATQAVFGEGPAKARAMLVGEQPGDFRFRTRGKRRIHQRPDREHVQACRRWFDAELSVVKPSVLVCLGAVAAQGLLGGHVRVTKDRGTPIESDLADFVTVTVHPSSILRAGDRREEAYEAFVSDLTNVAGVLG